MRTFACAAVMLIAIAVAVSVPFAATVFAQAGSTGGTLGNTDKSISGSREEPQEATSPRERSKRAAAVSISGKWAWTQKCDDGREFVGSFDLVQNGDGTVSGTVTGSDGSGPISGKLAGNIFTGSRSYNDHNTHIVITFSGRSLHATESSRDHGACHYQATRA
jgi:hypothetical protein